MPKVVLRGAVAGIDRRGRVKILFLHQNMPGQFKHLAPLLANAGHEVVFATRQKTLEIPGIRKLTYAPHRTVRASTHHYMRQFENSLLHGQGVARLCQQLAGEGFRPDLVISHPGWGEALFVKEIFPKAPLIGYCEFYYNGQGADVGFDPNQTVTLDDLCRIRARNAHLLLSLELCDRGWSPTQWQKSRHPPALRDKISVIFDGVDAHRAKPNLQARFRLPGGRVLTPGDEVITYISRNFEPYRGFPTFMRALPALLKARPKAQVVLVGGDGVSYGGRPPGGGTWRQHMLNEVGHLPDRVHFLGPQSHAAFLALLQVSSVHIYLTYPFVLSWSFMEAMATGCLMVASDTAPVREVLRHGENGYLTDFFDADRLAETVAAALEDPAAERLRGAARGTILGRYDIETCVPQQLKMIEEVSGRPILPRARS